MGNGAAGKAQSVCSLERVQVTIWGRICAKMGPRMRLESEGREYAGLFWGDGWGD